MRILMVLSDMRDIFAVAEVILLQMVAVIFYSPLPLKTHEAHITAKAITHEVHIIRHRRK